LRIEYPLLLWIPTSRHISVREGRAEPLAARKKRMRDACSTAGTLWLYPNLPEERGAAGRGGLNPGLSVLWTKLYSA
jgi:hypothetical protein